MRKKQNDEWNVIYQKICELIIEVGKIQTKTTRIKAEQLTNDITEYIRQNDVESIAGVLLDALKRVREGE